MVKKKNIPTLRFSKFNSEWEEKKLSTLCLKISDGIHTTPVYDDCGDAFFVNGNNLVDGSIVVNDNTKRVSSSEHNKYKVFLDDKSILMSINGTIGNLAYYNNERIILGKSACYINLLPDTDKRFIYNILQNPAVINYFNAELTGSTIKNLSLTTIKNTVLLIPSLPEQQKIASFLTSVDERIQQLTRKKNLLEQYKKTVIQKIFSRVIRFKDDKGNNFPDWEVKFAKDIFKNHTNKNHNGDLPILAATQDKGVVYRDSIDIKIQSSQESINTYKIVEVGDFVISLRSFQGGIEYSNVYGICSPAYTVLKPKIEISNEFFRYYFKRESFIQQLSSTVIGIRDGKQISYEPFSGLKLLFPSVKEQEKIGSFITALENKIELVNTQLEKTKAWKKGLLQKMFV